MSEWWSAADNELLHALSATQQKLNAAHRDMLELVAEVHARQLGGVHGFSTDIDLLRCTQNITQAEARRRIIAARDVLAGRTVTGEILPTVLPATAEAVAEDAISLDHVTTIERVLAGLAPHLECHRPELESYLAEQARTFDPRELRVLGQRRIAFLDPDGPTPRDTSPTRNKVSLAKDGDGWDVRGWFDHESAAILRTALSPLSGPRPMQDGERDTRTVAERTADGLIDLALRQLDIGDLPSEGGERPHVTVTIGLEQLASRLGNGLLDFAEGSVAGAISAENARRWACDARVTPIVLGGKSQPLDIGRSHRVVPRWLRRALHQRDGGCAFPGCTVAAQWCDAHHLIHWADGGTTSLHNLVLLCGHHHTVLHRGEWSATIVDDHPLFHPPPWIPGGPRRNGVHRIDLPLLFTSVRGSYDMTGSHDGGHRVAH